MKLRQKYLLLAVAPLALAMLAIALAVLHQASALAHHQRTLVETAYVQSKEAELRHYVDLAQSAIAPLVQSGRNDDATRRAAMDALARLDFGQDGYFFLYDMEGHALMHPRQPELVGQDLFQLRDAQGHPTIQQLIAAARSGGGTVRYVWRKPSTGQIAPKLGYVVAIPQWNWMIGTGIYR
jgi:two-component system NarL family sensor kinase